MGCCVSVYYGLCVPFVPAGHRAEFYSFVLLYIAVFVPGFALWLRCAAEAEHRRC